MIKNNYIYIYTINIDDDDINAVGIIKQYNFNVNYLIVFLIKRS